MDSNTILSLICIIIALAGFMYCSYKGLPPQLMAILFSIFVLITSGLNLEDGMFTTFMGSASGFFGKYFLTFLTGATFGAIMADSGAARSIGLKLGRVARKFKGHEKIAAMWCVPAVSFILSYGGISAYVAFFTIIAVTKELFEDMDIPWRLYGINILGAGVLALTMVPGSPSVNNAIAAEQLGTTAMSGAVLGLLGSVMAIAGAQIYFLWELKQVNKNDEHFLPTGKDIASVQFHDPKVDFKEMNIFLALIPSVALWIILNILKQKVWIATFFAIIIALILFWPRLKSKYMESFRRGIQQAMNSAVTVCLVVAFGSVIATTAGYGSVIGLLSRLGGNGYLQVVIAVNIGAGVTASSSGGLTIALNSLGQRFINSVQQGGLGLNPNAVHRLATISSGGLDSLPCNGTVLNELAQAKLKPSVGYRPFGVLSVFMTVLIAFILAIVANFGIV